MRAVNSVILPRQVQGVCAQRIARTRRLSAGTIVGSGTVSNRDAEEGPGKPNAAASSFVSGLFREPLNGEACALPVPLETVMPVLGYRSIVGGLIALHELDGGALGDDRGVGLPALNVSVGEMVEALQRVAQDRSLGKITVEPDPFIQKIVATWPQAVDAGRGEALGLPKEADLDEIVRAYIEDFLPT